MDVLALEIRTIWGASTIQHAYLSPPQSFADVTGAPLVSVDEEGVVTILRGSHPFRASATAGAARRVVLPVGGHARVERAGLAFEIALVRVADLQLPPRPRAARAALTSPATRAMALSFALHVGLAAWAAYHMPSLLPEAEAEIARDRLLFTRTQTEAPSEEEPVADEGEDDAVCRHHEVGITGTPSTRDKTKRRYGVAGPQDNADPHVARTLAEGPWAPHAFATIVLVPIRGDRKAYTMPWGRDEALGTDAASARGRMWGDSIGDVHGYAALGARLPHVDPPEEEDEEEEDETSLVGLIPSTVGRGTGFVPTRFDAAIWESRRWTSDDPSAVGAQGDPLR